MCGTAQQTVLWTPFLNHLVLRLEKVAKAEKEESSEVESNQRRHHNQDLHALDCK
jgi:hypothetical protein